MIRLLFRRRDAARAVRLAWALLPLAFAGGCAGPGVGAFAQERPVFHPVDFFTGRIVSWGVLEDRAGDPGKRFTATDIGHRSGDGVTIVQTIAYSDGTTQHRTWTLRRTGPGRYAGTAADIIGVARGETAGNALHLSYDLAPSPTDPFTHVHLNQWLYLQQGGDSLLSCTTISKLGITVTRAVEYVHRVPGAAAPPDAGPG